MPANLTTLPHFSVSSAMNFPKSAGELGSAVAPKSANRAFILGSARAALISLLSLSTISAGVLFGAPTPVQKLDSYPGTNSATVGMSGNTGERVAVVTASARSLPPLTYSIDEDMVANMTCTGPPSRSTSAGPAPRYGTCTRVTPVIILNSSPAIWVSGTNATRRHVDLPGIGLGIGDELGNRLDRHRGMHLHEKRLAMNACDRSDVADQIETELVVERGVDRVHHSGHKQRISVRGRVHDRLGTDIAGRARPILDDKLLTETLR